MASIELRLLGGFHFTSAGQPITQFRSNKVRALLAYLAAEARPHTRAHLVGLLWPELPEASALNNLSQTLGRLQQALGSVRPAAPLVVTTRQEVRFNRDSQVWVDVLEFERAVALASAAIMPSRRAATIAQLEHAAALYEGDFLAGFTLPECEAWESWMLLRRDALQRGALDMLYTLAAFYMELGDYVRARHMAQQQLRIDSWREEAHRQLMEALAADGQRGEALQQYERCRHLLREEAGFEPQPATVALAEAIRRGELDAAAMPATLARPRHNLPGPRAPLIGRADVLAALLRDLALPATRLLTLLGPGGVGKTRLALAVAQALVDIQNGAGGTTAALPGAPEPRFPDGVWFVPLAGIAEDAADVREAVAVALVNALGFTLGGTQPAWEQLVAYLRPKRLLLMLDNAEHMPLIASVVLDLLQAAPQAVVLLTSRARLGLDAEQIRLLAGLVAPPAETTVVDDTYSAAELFLERARHAVPDLQLDAASMAAVGRICRLVDGLPLGLELAAQWVDHFTCREIADAIEHNLDFLVAADPAAMERHGSVRAVFRYSWDLLTGSEQRTLARLAVFRGSFGRQAALAVTQAALSDLTALVGKSLVRLVRPGRYELHSLLRVFANEQLLAMETDGDAVPGGSAERHMHVYLDSLHENEQHLYGSDPQQVVGELRADLENIQQAWQHACRHAHVAALGRGRAGLARFLRITGLLRAGAEHFAAAWEASRTTAARVPATADHTALEGGWLLLEYARFQEVLADFEAGTAAGAEALLLAERFQSVPLKAAAHTCLGALLAQQGQHRAARPHLDTAVTLAQTAQLPQLEATSRYGLGRAAFHEGEYDEAQRQLTAALRLLEPLGDTWDVARVTAFGGVVSYHLGYSATGRQQLDTALRLFQRMGDLIGELAVLQNLGALAGEEGDYVVAQRAFQRYVALMHELGARQDESVGLSNLGLVAYYLGQHAQAWQHFEEALQLSRAVGDPLGEGMSLVYLALLHQQAEEYAAAAKLCRQALQIAHTHALPLLEASAWLYLGHARTGLNSADAAEAFERCVALQDDLGHTHTAMEAIAGLARLVLARGAAPRARALVEELLPDLEHGLEGAFDPFRVYLTCYEVLHHAGDPRAAQIGAQGRARLQALADKIDDPALRESFLTNAPAQRALMQCKGSDGAAFRRVLQHAQG